MPADGRTSPPISPTMVARSRTVAEPRWSPGGTRLAWVESLGERADVVVAPADARAPAVVVTADVAVRRGGAFCFADDDHLVVAGADGRLLLVHADGASVRVLTRDGRAFAPAVSSRGQVAVCIERDDACDVAVVPLDAGAWPARVSHADYAWDPSWSPDGTRLAWHEWDLPNLPWDAGRVVVAAPDGSGARVLAGGDGVGVGQPRFSARGDLAWTSDDGGFANVWVAGPDGADARPLLRERHEHAEPSWGPGQRSYAWSPDGSEVAWCRNEAGFGRLVVGAPGRRSARELSKGWHRGLDWGTRGIVCVRTGARTPDEIVVLGADGSSRRTVARGPVGGFEAAALAEPRAVAWKSGGAVVHGLWYEPPEPALGPGTAPPLLVDVHGGPNGQAIAAWNADVAFWVARGWAVLRPNHRGSSGYGRAHLQALAGRWGERDVADVAAGIRHAVREAWCDPARVAVRGGSAGGLTALLVCARHGALVRAGVAVSAVTDLVELAATTHRFEAGSIGRLVGELPAHAARYEERSPVTNAARIDVPVLLLHGSADDVVPPAQADAMVEALRAAGAHVEDHWYEGAGHHLSDPAHVVDELERTDAFLTRWVLRR